MQVLNLILLAVVPSATAIVTLWMGQRQARTTAAEERTARASAEAEQRVFEARRDRYGDRLETAAAFVRAIEHEERSMDEYGEKHPGEGPPGDVFDNYGFAESRAALSKLLLIADERTAEAARALMDSTVRLFFDWGERDSHVARRETFDEACRGMLVADAA